MALIKWFLGFLGYAAGNAAANPPVPGAVLNLVDKFAGVIAAVAAGWWLLGNRAVVVELNYLELAGLVLIFNMALKAAPPGPPGPG